MKKLFLSLLLLVPATSLIANFDQDIDEDEYDSLSLNVLAIWSRCHDQRISNQCITESPLSYLLSINTPAAHKIIIDMLRVNLYAARTFTVTGCSESHYEFILVPNCVRRNGTFLCSDCAAKAPISLPPFLNSDGLFGTLGVNRRNS